MINDIRRVPSHLPRVQGFSRVFPSQTLDLLSVAIACTLLAGYTPGQRSIEPGLSLLSPSSWRGVTRLGTVLAALALSHVLLTFVKAPD